MSYCDTDLGLFEFCGCEPAYMVSACAKPSVAKPAGADVVSSHDAPGWPVPLGFRAADAAPAGTTRAAVTAIRNTLRRTALITSPPCQCRCGYLRPAPTMGSATHPAVAGHPAMCRYAQFV